MNNLGRINLLVGANNSGKTSLLEAIELLLARGDPRSIWMALNRRGERLFEEDDRRAGAELDVCRLFNGHQLAQGSSFKLLAYDDVHVSQELLSNVSELNETEWSQAILPPLEQQFEFSTLGLQLVWRGGDLASEEVSLPLTEKGGLSVDLLRRRPVRKEEGRQPAAFISTSSLAPDEVVSLLSRIILNPEEDLLLRALRIIEPNIERIAPVSGPRYSQSTPSRGGVVIKLKNYDKRLPIGTMGDGIWRLLSLALSLVRAAGGVLLVDEIDTGLHYSVMEKMWKLIHEISEKLNIQVFATTHSNDCWKALGSISRYGYQSYNEISIQRIERGKRESIPFSEHEIIIATERGLEIR